MQDAELLPFLLYRKLCCARASAQKEAVNAYALQQFFALQV